MLLARNLFFAVVLSTMLAFMLSFLPLNEEYEDRFAPVFQATETMVLKNDNLVDVLSALETRLPFSHVKWENDNLFLDHEVNIDKPIYVDDIYADLFSALKFVYLQTNNVKGLYIRFLYKEKGTDQVLIALSAERTDDLIEELKRAEDKKLFLHTYTTLSYGVHWKENIQN